MKKKIVKIGIFVSFVALACLGIDFAKEKQDAKFNFLLKSIDAYASPENEPGHYTGAYNAYCKSPSNTRGCLNDPDPTRKCTYSVFCIK